jgi:hypothetical protein
MLHKVFAFPRSSCIHEPLPNVDQRVFGFRSNTANAGKFVSEALAVTPLIGVSVHVTGFLAAMTGVDKLSPSPVVDIRSTAIRNSPMNLDEKRTISLFKMYIS